MHQRNDAILYFYFYTCFLFIEFQYVVLIELQTIKDSQKTILERIDAIDGGDGEGNATLDEITKLTTQEEFDCEETKLQDKAYRRRKVNFKILDL